MSPSSSSPRGLYFEQFQVGQKMITDGRTISEADLVTFAGLSGDFTSIHTDAEYARGTQYGQRIAHGLLGLSIATGLAVSTGFIHGTVLAFREVSDWKFGKPVFIGDTIHAELEVTETKALPRVGGGAVTMSVNVKNQRDESTMRGSWVMLVARRPK